MSAAPTSPTTAAPRVTWLGVNGRWHRRWRVMKNETGLLRRGGTNPRSPSISSAKMALSALLREASSTTFIPPSSERFDGRTSLAPISTAFPSSLRRAARSSGRGTLRRITEGGRYLGRVQLPSEARMMDRPMRSICLMDRSTTESPATHMLAPTTSAAVARRSAGRLLGGALGGGAEVSIGDGLSVTVLLTQGRSLPEKQRKCTNYAAEGTASNGCGYSSGRRNMFSGRPDHQVTWTPAIRARK